MSSARGPGSPISFIRPALSLAECRGTDKWNGQRNPFATRKFFPAEKISWMRSSKQMIPCWPARKYRRDAAKLQISFKSKTADMLYAINLEHKSFFFKLLVYYCINCLLMLIWTNVQLSFKIFAIFLPVFSHAVINKSWFNKKLKAAREYRQSRL